MTLVETFIEPRVAESLHGSGDGDRARRRGEGHALPGAAGEHGVVHDRARRVLAWAPIRRYKSVMVYEAGAGLMRLDLEVLIEGQGAFADLTACTSRRATQHIDNIVSIDHAKPHSTEPALLQGHPRRQVARGVRRHGLRAAGSRQDGRLPGGQEHAPLAPGGGRQQAEPRDLRRRCEVRPRGDGGRRRGGGDLLHAVARASDEQTASRLLIKGFASEIRAIRSSGEYERAAHVPGGSGPRLALPAVSLVGREDGGMTLDVARIRKDFPILERKVYGKPLVYLDNAATSQKPRQVIDALVDYYENYNANIHRGRALPRRRGDGGLRRGAREGRERSSTRLITECDRLHPQHDRGDQPGRAQLGSREHPRRRRDPAHADGAPLEPRSPGSTGGREGRDGALRAGDRARRRWSWTGSRTCSTRARR